MIITYGGLECVKIQQGDFTFAFNPISKDSKFKGLRFGTDICLISLNHPDTNGVDAVSRGDKEPFIVNGPGEYEVSGYVIKGIASKSEYGGSEKINTIYLVNIDGINVVYFGALGEAELSTEAKEIIGEADILFVPIGGDGVLDSAEAYKLAVKREPRIIIPIHYGEVGEKGSLDNFLKEGGHEKIKPLDKLTIKKKDIESKEGEIIVLESALS
jgi:L-ascorbate metabolism protein UlaG (beta-lactamase superfamily)